MDGLGVRLKIDPAVHNYYAAGLTLGVLAWELSRRPERAPWLAVATALALLVTPRDVQPPSLAGLLRLAVTAFVVVLAVLVRPPPDVPEAVRQLPGGQIDDEARA
jgi:hypothetical protein